MKALRIALIASLCVGTAAVANEVVDARKGAMKSLGGAAKVLGGMASGKADFDAAAAADAKAAMVAAATAIPALYEEEVLASNSKALPVIWSDFDGFKAKAMDLQSAAEAMDTTTLEGVQAGMGAVGPTCGACHKGYRS